MKTAIATLPEVQSAKCKVQSPTWENELELHSEGFTVIAGVDEVGRGAWAGPLVAAAVVFRGETMDDEATLSSAIRRPPSGLARLRDSKLLTACVREELLGCILSNALAVGTGIVSRALLDVIGVGPANRLAMARAVRDLGLWPDFLLLDAFPLRAMPIPQRPIIRGDATCMSIAAASVVAKVTRDRMMCQLDEQYPGYGFAQHKGYGTNLHVKALEELGISPIHRHSFAPIRELGLGR